MVAARARFGTDRDAALGCARTERGALDCRCCCCCCSGSVRSEKPAPHGSIGCYFCLRAERGGVSQLLGEPSTWRDNQWHHRLGRYTSGADGAISGLAGPTGR